MDLHEDIHRAAESYLDENEFRRWINSAIQNSRGVTFLLQKRKAKWSDFDDWYGAWQSAARLNQVLSWGVGARNRIVKEEDLRTFSQAVVGVYGVRLKEAEDVWVVPPDMEVQEIVTQFLQRAGTSSEHLTGWIRVQRRWIDDELPDYELVSALHEIYRVVADVVREAHRRSGVSACLAPSFPRECVSSAIVPNLECFGKNPVPSLIVNLETGEEVTIDRVRVDLDASAVDRGEQRYGYRPKRTNDPIEHAIGRLELSKVFLQKDGYAGPSLALFGDGGIHLHSVMFGDDEPRELKIAAAVESEGAWQFHGAVYSSETWLGLPGSRGTFLNVPKHRLLGSNDDLFHAKRALGRDEALIVIALSSDGRSRTLTLPFGRVLGGYVFGELVDDDSGAMVPTFLRPIWQHWDNPKASS